MWDFDQETRILDLAVTANLDEDLLTIVSRIFRRPGNYITVNDRYCLKPRVDTRQTQLPDLGPVCMEVGDPR